MSGEGNKAPKRGERPLKEAKEAQAATGAKATPDEKGADAKGTPDPKGTPDAKGAGAPEGGKAEGTSELGSPADPDTRQFFLIEYVNELLKGVRWLRASPKPEEPVVRRVQKGLLRWSRGRKSRIGVLVVIGIIAISYVLFSAQASSIDVVDGGAGGGGGGPGANTGTFSISGSVAENMRSDNTVNIENTTSFAGFTITLTWNDEPASNPTVRNQPDNLGLNITAPNGMSWEVAPSASQRVSWTLDETGQDMGGNQWTVTVIGGTMGDEVPITGRPGPCVRCQADNTNSYTVTGDYSW